MTGAGRWIVPWSAHPARSPVLLCIPPAGAGCGRYRQWHEVLGPAVSVIGVQLPGREQRWAEPPARTMAEVVDGVTRELCELLPVGTALTVFGESFGGLIGYELARRLGEVHQRSPAALVVAACRPPSMWTGAGRGLAEDDEALARLLDLRGLEDLLDEDSRDLMLEVLRTDARLSLTFVDPQGARVPCPLYAWGGDSDEVVPYADLDGWHGYAGEEGFSKHRFPGGHHFCSERGDLVTRAVKELMAPLAAPCTDSVEEG